jgi:hypothetical protein
MKKLFANIILVCICSVGLAQSSRSFMLASNYFDDGQKLASTTDDRRYGDFVFGLIEDFTTEYVSYRKVTTKETGEPITDKDIVVGKGIYRKKGKEYFKMIFDGPVNIRWYGAVADGRTDNALCISQALEASPYVKIPAGNYGIASPITVNATATITGESPLASKLTCLNTDMSALVVGEKSTTRNISLLTLANFCISKGKFGISAVRQTGDELVIERISIKNLQFEEQSSAGIYMSGKKLLFLVNVLQENTFRYCGTGILLERVFSANLNHFLLNRFEGTKGAIAISTTNNELTQLTIDKNRFEAITSTNAVTSAIMIKGGSQNVSIADNYFEDVPDPVLSIDAGTGGMAISPSILNNQFSANIKGSVMVKLASQVKSPLFVSNVFKPGKSGVKLDFSPYVSEPVFYANNGDVSFVSYPVSYKSLQKNSLQLQVDNHFFKKDIAHDGDFKFVVKMPSSGIFNVVLAVAEDGDFGLGGVVRYTVGWLKATSPLLFSEPIYSKYKPNTVSIAVSAPSADGFLTISVIKSDKLHRLASCYYSIIPELEIDRTNILPH